MTKDERIKELETIAMRLFDMVHEGNLAELQIEANELYPRIVNIGVLDGVIKCNHHWIDCRPTFKIRQCSKCLDAELIK